jgi:hypothetical protein
MDSTSATWFIEPKMLDLQNIGIVLVALVTAILILKPTPFTQKATDLISFLVGVC